MPNAHAFADDTQLYLSFNPDNSLNEAEAVHAIEQCIRAMQADKLKLNENKTEVMLIGTRQQLSKVNLGTLTVGDSSVAVVSKARNRVLIKILLLWKTWIGYQLNTVCLNWLYTHSKLYMVELPHVFIN